MVSQAHIDKIVRLLPRSQELLRLGGAGSVLIHNHGQAVTLLQEAPQVHRNRPGHTDR